MAIPEVQTWQDVSRVNDNSALLEWYNNTAAAPYEYDGQWVEIRKWEGSYWGYWYGNVTLPAGSAGPESYTWAGLSPNNIYSWRLRAYNITNGATYFSDWSESTDVLGSPSDGEVWMTPAAPSNVQIVLLDADSIRVTWTENQYTPFAPVPTFTIQRSVNGGAFSTVRSGQTGHQWTDNSVPAGNTYQYRVLCTVASRSVSSAYVNSNIITLAVAPLAPTQLAPNGTGADMTDPVTFTWQHNHGGDQAAQSHFTLQTSIDAGVNWITRANDIASTASSYTMAGGTLANGNTYQWHVKTEGIVSAGYGPYSAAATIIGSAQPTVTIQASYPPATLVSGSLDLRWNYSQGQSSPQAAWEAELWNTADTVMYERRTGTGTGTATVFDYVLVNGTSYHVRIRAQSGAGVWSDWVSKTFAFSLLPPANSYGVAEFQPCSGTVSIELSKDPPETGVTVAVVSTIIERRINGGAWVTIASGVPNPSMFVDVVPITNGTNEYRLTSVSADPSYAVMAPFTVMGTAGTDPNGLWAFLSYGDGFFNVLRVRGDLSISERASRVRAAQQFLGRTHPVLLVGQQVTRQVTCSGNLHYDATCLVDDDCTYDSPPADWIAASQVAEIVCYRDFTGRRLFGMLSEVDATDGLWRGHASVGFSVTETDFVEVAGTVV